MTLTAFRTTAGFEPVRHRKNQPIIPHEYELTPNTAFSKGDMVVATAGKIAKAAASATNVFGVMAQAFTTTTNPLAATTIGRVYDDEDIVYRCTFSDQYDGTATSGSTTTLADTNFGSLADDRMIGAYLYVYEGTNAGEARTVSGYTNASRLFTWIEPMPAACDTTSKFIVLGAGAAAGDVINVGKIGVNLKDENTIDANATVDSDPGPLKVEAIYPEDLMMDVTIRKSVYKTP